MTNADSFLTPAAELAGLSEDDCFWQCEPCGAEGSYIHPDEPPVVVDGIVCCRDCADSILGTAAVAS